MHTEKGTEEPTELLKAVQSAEPSTAFTAIITLKRKLPELEMYHNLIVKVLLDTMDCDNPKIQTTLIQTVFQLIKLKSTAYFNNQYYMLLVKKITVMENEHIWKEFLKWLDYLDLKCFFYKNLRFLD
jgi:hypothetical protein